MLCQMGHTDLMAYIVNEESSSSLLRKQKWTPRSTENHQFPCSRMIVVPGESRTRAHTTVSSQHCLSFIVFSSCHVLEDTVQCLAPGSPLAEGKWKTQDTKPSKGRCCRFLILDSLQKMLWCSLHQVNQNFYRLAEFWKMCDFRGRCCSIAG